MFWNRKTKQVAKVDSDLSLLIREESSDENYHRLSVEEEKTRQHGVKLAIASRKVTEKRVELQRQTMRTMESAIRRGLMDARGREVLALCAASLAYSSDRKSAARTFKRFASR